MANRHFRLGVWDRAPCRVSTFDGQAAKGQSHQSWSSDRRRDEQIVGCLIAADCVLGWNQPLGPGLAVRCVEQGLQPGC